MLGARKRNIIIFRTMHYNMATATAAAAAAANGNLFTKGLR